MTINISNAVRIRLVSDYMDVLKFLPQVKVPTLVLHCHGDLVQAFEEGRILAAGIPGARFVGLEGRYHLIFETDPGWGRFQEKVAAGPRLSATTCVQSLGPDCRRGDRS